MNLKKNIMKNLYKLLPPLLSLLVIYLLGVFYATSFDITRWTEGTRLTVCVFGGVTFAIIMLFSEIGFEE